MPREAIGAWRRQNGLHSSLELGFILVPLTSQLNSFSGLYESYTLHFITSIQMICLVLRGWSILVVSLPKF